MEKYRKFGDAATGIHPFTVVIAPKSWGVAVAALLFPVRLILSTVLALLLLVTDTLAGLLYVVYLGFLGRRLVSPVGRLWLRGLLLTLGHVLVEAEAVPVDGERRGSRVGGRGGPPSAASLARGDVVVANMQSVWDIFALEVALGLSYYTVALPCPVATAPPGGSPASATASSPESTRAVRWGVHVIGPGPLQRWFVWRQVRSSGTLDYLRAAASASASASAGLVDLATVQAAASVPIVCFVEATCSNGKGILSMGPMRIRTNRHPARPGDDPAATAHSPVVAVAAVTYNTPALQNVVSEGEGTLAYLFRVGQLVFGSAAPAWSSPFIPTALVQYRPAVRLPGARPDGAEVVGATAAGPPAAMRDYVLGTAAVDALREAMCMRAAGRATGAGVGGVRRQPLSVGVQEKVGFLETYLAANKVA